MTKSGNYLKECRTLLGLTQKELGDKLGIHGQFVSNWERGDCLIPPSLVKPTVKLLKISKDQLMIRLADDWLETLYREVG